MGAGWLKRVSDNETVLLCSQCAQDEARWPVELSGAAGSLVGIGTGGESIGHFGQSYREALSAIDIARRLGLPGTCFHYVALMAYEIGAELLRCGSPGNFAAGLVQKVFEYDKVKEGELLDTLEVYLDLLGERRKAARALNIHANTLDYRIRRIKDIMGVDFDAPELRLPVHLWVKAKKVEFASGLVSAQ